MQTRGIHVPLVVSNKKALADTAVRHCPGTKCLYLTGVIGSDT